MICISCGFEHNEKFCPNCGEKSDVPKITFISTIQTSLSTLVEMDKGFLYNLKNLTLRPKVTIEKYISGKRKGIFNPISFLIISVTVYLLIESFFKTKNFASKEAVDLVRDDFSYKIGASGGRFIYDYFKYFWIFTVIPLSLITKLFFKRFNFAEHITINSFILGQVTLIIGSLSFAIFRFAILFNPFVYLGLIWLLSRTFYNPKNKSDSVIKAFTTIFFFMFFLFISITLIGLIRLI
ncbi:MAG: DUF3667 domain-containing protein [Tenacibaculum sp.]|nr:DUF3667 domain-containing protein [Tenacibaculum sp.]